MFYTRFNVSKLLDYKEEYSRYSGIYFPLIGWFIGGITAIIFLASSLVLNDYISVIIALLSGVIATGAIHEDGLADTIDGMGGGWNKEARLKIMKDSSIGAFGTLGLVFTVFLKISLLSEVYALSNNTISIILFTIIAHSLSRFVAVTFMYSHEYARSDENSKSSNLVTKMGFSSISYAFIWGILPLVIYSVYSEFYYFLTIPLTCFIIKAFLGKFFQKRIGGYTGDTLGATQQITEIVIFIQILVICRFI